jgi:hypothetical protein
MDALRAGIDAWRREWRAAAAMARISTSHR